MRPFFERATRLAILLLFSLGLAGGAGTTVTSATAGPDERPGDRFEFRVEDLPALNETPNGVSAPKVVARTDDDRLYVPEGFEANIFAEGLSFPRWIAVAPNGDIFLTQADSRFREVAEPNRIMVLRDEDGDGVADMKSTFAEGFDKPLGIVVQGNNILVADLNGVWRLPYTDGALKAETREQITAPGALGGKEGHYHRVIALHPDGEHMIITVGSASNVAEDPSPHATIQRFRLDGSEQMTFASGTRNPIGTAFYPGTDDLYTVVNERDMYGDDLVPDYFSRVEEGDFFGWPYAYMGPNPDPEFGDKRPDLVAATKVPDVLFDAHSAPVGLVFYDGEQFPDDYRGDALVALHGSFKHNNTNRLQSRAHSV